MLIPMNKLNIIKVFMRNEELYLERFETTIEKNKNLMNITLDVI